MAEKLSDVELLSRKLKEILAPYRAQVLPTIDFNSSIEGSIEEFVIEYEQRMIERIFEDLKSQPSLSVYLASAMMMLRRMK